MRKIDKLVDKSPIIYALLLPVVFYLQVAGATFLNIHPVILDLLDALKIPVIVAFSFYITKTLDISESGKDPGKVLMVMAGVSFLELVFNVMVSLGLTTVNQELSFTVMILFFIAQMALETGAFAIIANNFELLVVVIWVAIHIMLLILFLALCNDPGENLLKPMLGAIVLRDIYKGRIIYILRKNIRCEESITNKLL